MIEGYLVKAIETKRMLKVTQQHLRYFRVIFSTGKMNVKEDRDDPQMRSFPLANLKSVQLNKVWEKTAIGSPQSAETVF